MLITNLSPMTYKQQRILTTAQLADSYGADPQLLVNNYNRNRERYTEGKHYILLQGAELLEFRTKNQIDLSPHAYRLYLWTEKGAWLHAKSLNTDRAWEAYEALVDDYFRIRAQPAQALPASMSPELQAIILLDRRTQDIGAEVEMLKNTTTIDYGQQQSLKKLGSARILELIGGRNAPTYRDGRLRSRMYSALWNDFQEFFAVNSYANTLRVELERARAYVPRWTPPNNLMREIEAANGQLQF